VPIEKKIQLKTVQAIVSAEVAEKEPMTLSSVDRMVQLIHLKFLL
jgi:hypothetical protein